MSSQFLRPYLKKLKTSSLERRIPNISEQNSEFLKRLIQEKSPKHILEIGTANGYSTLCFAEALVRQESENSQKQEVQGGSDFLQWVYEWIHEREKYDSNDEIHSFSWFSITTIEYAWNAHIEAIEHFRNCKVKNIHSIWWDAKAVIPTLADGYFDFIFIDAMKKEYLDYLLASLPKCTPDALIVIDDVEKFASKMENLYTWLQENHVPYQIAKTDEDDSIMILERTSFS